MNLFNAMVKTKQGGGADRETIARIQNQRLEKLVRYARANSPYYQRLYTDVDDGFCLEDLPTTSKPEMMASFDDFVTDRNITMRMIDAFTADLDNIGRMLDGKYLIFKTSGSTGNPAVVLYDKQKVLCEKRLLRVRRETVLARAKDHRKLELSHAVLIDCNHSVKTGYEEGECRR